MISYLLGKLGEKGPTHMVVEVGGIGLTVRIPLSSSAPDLKIGTMVKILTHLHVREDALLLYGFSTQAERSLFQILITVSGIGPPMALNILSGVQVERFERLIASEDAKGLTSIKGIGPKLARRLMVTGGILSGNRIRTPCPPLNVRRTAPGRSGSCRVSSTWSIFTSS